MTLPPRDTDGYARKNWPWLGALFGACILWYELGGNHLAGVAGFAGIGWLVWALVIKPRL